jgi:hypothetical protein
MPKADRLSNSVPRVELDQRARDARRRLAQVERLLVPRAAATASWLRRVLFRVTCGIYGDHSRGGRTRGPLSNRRSSRTPQIHQVWLGMRSSFWRTGAFASSPFHRMTGAARGGLRARVPTNRWGRRQAFRSTRSIAATATP